MSNSIGRIDLDLGVNTSGFKKQLSGISKQGDGLTSMFGKLGKVAAAAFSVKAIVSFSKQCLQLGSDLAEVQNVVDVTFGSMSEAVNNWAKNAMTSYGLSEKVAKEYMGQFGAMSKAFGNTEEMAYSQAAALTGLAGDVASFYNMSTDEAFTKLKAVYTGETEALKSLGVVMTQSALDSYAMANGFGKTTKNMSEQEKVALRLAFVQDKLAGASGDFARTSDGWANQTRVLALRFDALKASIGQGLINVLLPVIRMLNTLMSHLQAAADAFANFTATIFGDAGGSASSAASTMSSASADLADNTDSAAGSAAKIKKSLAGFDNLNILSSPDSGTSDAGSSGGSSIAAPIIDPVETSENNKATDKLNAKLKGVLNTLKKITKLTGLAGLWDDFMIGVDNAKQGVNNIFSALRNGFANAAPSLDALKQSLSNTFLTISQTITGIWGDIWVTLTENFQLWTANNAAGLETFFTNAITIIADFRTLISDVVGDIFEDIKAWWEESGKGVFDGVVKAIGDVYTWVLDLYNTVIAPVISKVIEAARDLWENNLRPLWQNLLGAVSDVGEFFLVLWNNVLKPVVDWIIEHLGPPIRKIIEAIVEKVKETFAAISRIVNNIIDVFRGIIRFFTDVFSGDWEAAWEDVKDIFSGIWEGIKAKVGFILNPVLASFESFINHIIDGLNWLIDQINKISFDVPDWVPGIGGKTMGFDISHVHSVTLPRLATGGYVAANTPQLAIVGDNKREGEIIAPESKIAEAVAAGFAAVMAKMQATSAGTERPMYLTLKLGEENFWEGFVDYHNSVVKRTGDSPLLI
jgi:hypothetical protein